MQSDAMRGPPVFGGPLFVQRFFGAYVKVNCRACTLAYNVLIVGQLWRAGA